MAATQSKPECAECQGTGFRYTSSTAVSPCMCDGRDTLDPLIPIGVPPLERSFNAAGMKPWQSAHLAAVEAITARGESVILTGPAGHGKTVIAIVALTNAAMA